MIDTSVGITTAFLFNYFIHSTVFIALALLALKLRKLSFDQSGEWLLKGCFVLGALTAFIQSSGMLNGLTMNQYLTWQLATQTTQPQTSNKSEKPVAIKSKSQKHSEPTVASHVVSTQQNNNRPIPVETNDQTASISTQAVPALLLVWLLGMIYLVSKKLLQYQQFKNLLSDRTPVKSKQVTELVKEINAQAQLKKPVKITTSQHLNSPIALISGEVILPMDFIEKHNHAQLKAALAHELAHLKRLDGYWLWFSVVFEAILFFQPLNKIITNQIHQLTEQRADQLAAQWTNNPKALAETLSAVAHDNFYNNSSPMVTAMTSKKSNLLSRIENLLLKHPSKRTRPQMMIFTVFIGSAVLLTAPGISIENAWASQSKEGNSSHSHSVSIEDNGSVTDISTSHTNDEGTIKLKAKIKGQLKFNEDETDLIAFPKSSKFDLRYKRNGLDRRLIIKSQSGAPVYTYYEDGDEMPYDGEARAWFASIIPELLRTTGIDAEARVVRIQRAHGDDAVLDEVELIHSDWVRNRYLSKLFTLGELSENDLIRAIDLSAEIGSDFEQSKVFSIMVRHQNIEGEDMWQEVLNASQNIGSDFEMAKTLTNFIKFLPDTQTINRSYFDAAKSIGSDFEMKKVLSKYMMNKPNSVNMIEMFDVAKDIGSDFELANLLIEVNQQLGDSNEVFAAYLDLAESIGSDFEMKKVYSNLLKHDLDENNLERLIESAKTQIGSDFELSNLLLDVLNSQDLNSNLLADLKNATNSIGSRFERNKVLEALVNRM